MAGWKLERVRWVIIDDVVMTESYYLLLFVVGYEQAADLGIWRTGEDIDFDVASEHNYEQELDSCEEG